MLCSCTCLFSFPEHKSKAGSSSKKKAKNKNRSKLGSLLLQVNLRPLLLGKWDRILSQGTVTYAVDAVPEDGTVKIGSISHALIKLRLSQPPKELKLF